MLSSIYLVITWYIILNTFLTIASLPLLSATSVSRLHSQVIVVTDDQNLVFHSLPDFSRNKLIVGFNDEIVDLKYLAQDDKRIAVATNSQQV